MFENNGAPTGYNQIQPGLDQPRQTRPGQPGRPPNPLQNAITNQPGPGPSEYPVDPGFLQWRQKEQKPQGPQPTMMHTMGGSPQPNFNPGLVPQAPPTDVFQNQSDPILRGGGAPNWNPGLTPALPPGGGNPQQPQTGLLKPNDPVFRSGFGTPPPTAQPQNNFGNLSDPATWMSMVGDRQRLAQWVTQGLGAGAQKPGLVDYYVGKIQGQPGANEHEQQGSASYWMQKLQNDPNVTGHAAPQGAGAFRQFGGAMAGGSSGGALQTNPSLLNAVLYGGQGSQPSNYLQQLMHQQV